MVPQESANYHLVRLKGYPSLELWRSSPFSSSSATLDDLNLVPLARPREFLRTDLDQRGK